ncbi:hypothetical protein HHK36_025058 [Tetracentron sinense]|uniref:mRNA export factor GLE1 n=1 Tax=Tetracentron sinense TaxID=13715 RepID=A0A834YRY0_TETSI|nr:hypothetical protein HHK36_025058 [Tetracentron sinense]
MGAVNLELRCPKSIHGIVVDPEPDWSLDSLLSELNSLELKLNASLMAPAPFTKTRLREFSNMNGIRRSPRAFVMRISDDEMDGIKSEGEDVHDRSIVAGNRFTCAELYLSESEDESALEETQTHLIGKVGLVENLLFELNHEHELGVKDEIRNQISALETDMINESERSTFAHVQVEKYTETRLEMDRKLDAQYQRKIAEALDNHLTAVLRDHEHRSQIEERKIRNDAAFEEAKRKERALQEEKLRQEKAKAEAESVETSIARKGRQAPVPSPRSEIDTGRAGELSNPIGVEAVSLRKTIESTVESYAGCAEKVARDKGAKHRRSRRNQRRAVQRKKIRVWKRKVSKEGVLSSTPEEPCAKLLQSDQGRTSWGRCPTEISYELGRGSGSLGPVIAEEEKEVQQWDSGTQLNITGWRGEGPMVPFNLGLDPDDPFGLDHLIFRTGSFKRQGLVGGDLATDSGRDGLLKTNNSAIGEEKGGFAGKDVSASSNWNQASVQTCQRAAQVSDAQGEVSEFCLEGGSPGAGPSDGEGIRCGGDEASRGVVVAVRSEVEVEGRPDEGEGVVEEDGGWYFPINPLPSQAVQEVVDSVEPGGASLQVGCRGGFDLVERGPEPGKPVYLSPARVELTREKVMGSSAVDPHQVEDPVARHLEAGEIGQSSEPLRGAGLSGSISDSPLDQEEATEWVLSEVEGVSSFLGISVEEHREEAKILFQKCEVSGALEEVRLEAAKKRAEEAKKATLEAERRAAKEASERETTETTKMMSPEVARKEAMGRQGEVKAEGLNAQSKGSGFGPNKAQSAGNILKSADSALKVEEGRLQKFKELDEKNRALSLSSKKDFHSYELQIARRIKQITGTKENVRSKANDLIKIFNDPICPQSISIALFAKKKQREAMKVVKLLYGLPNEYQSLKDQILGGDAIPYVTEVYARLQRISVGNDVMGSQSSSGERPTTNASSNTGADQITVMVVSQCENPSASFGSTAFACGHVIVLVTSQVPLAMDLVLAEFHRACIYTVPKHINYSESAFETTETYYKMIGYREEDGKIESTDHYLERLESYMKLYGALIQTEVDGIQNTHGLKEGWAWLARFLNALPANIYTAVALEAFLKMAGFALFRKYKSQFRKILNIISRNFLDALKARGDPKLNPVITRLKSYIETNQFLQEPEGWRLRTSLLSDVCVPESDSGFYQEQYQYQSNRRLAINSGRNKNNKFHNNIPECGGKNIRISQESVMSSIASPNLNKNLERMKLQKLLVELKFVGNGG